MRGKLTITSVPGMLALFLAIPAQGQQAGPPRLSALDSLLSTPISTAARYEQLSREAPASITVLTRDDLERFGFTVVAEALESLRGFYSTFDRNQSNIGVRGISRPSDTNKRILLLVDGIPWNDVGNNQAVVGTGLGMPVEMLERIEVVRGPGSALYGSSAMLAVVNLVTRNGVSLSGLRTVAEAGSYGWNSLRAAAGKLFADGTDVKGHLAWIGSDGPDTYFPEFVGEPGGGHLSGRNSQRQLGWGVEASRSGLTALIRGASQYNDDPTAPLGSSFDTDGTYRDSHRVSGALVWEQDLTHRLNLRTELFAHRSWVSLGYAFDEPQPDRVMGWHGTKWGGEAQLRFDVNPSNRLVLGVVHHRLAPNVYVNSGGQRGLDTRPEINLASAFVQDEWALSSRLRVVAGMRADRYSTAGSAVSPRAAAVYHPSSSSSLKLLYGSAFRTPTLIEQFVEEPGVGKPNHDLDPERIRQMELVWEQRLGRYLQLATSAFEYRMTDLISLTIDESDGLFQHQNIDRARSRGVSAEIFGRLPGGTSVFVNGTWQQAEDEATSVQLPNAPEYLFRIGASTVLPTGIRAGAVAMTDGNRNSIHGLPTDGHTVANLTLTTPSVSGFTAQFSVRNVFDTYFWHPAGTEHRQIAIPQDGRSIRLTLSAAF